MYGFRQRDRKKQSPQGYTFSTRYEKAEINNSPSPTLYHKEKDWTTNSFNTKFIKNSENFPVHRREDQIEVNEITVKPIRI